MKSNLRVGSVFEDNSSKAIHYMIVQRIINSLIVQTYTKNVID